MINFCNVYYDRFYRTTKNDNKRFFFEKSILKGINFKINNNEKIGIIGSRGSGKTTIFKLIEGSLLPLQGKIDIISNVYFYRSIKNFLNLEISLRQNILDLFFFYNLDNNFTYNYFLNVNRLNDDIKKFIDLPAKLLPIHFYKYFQIDLIDHNKYQILLYDDILPHNNDETLLSKNKTILLSSRSHEKLRNITNKIIWLRNGLIESFDSTEIVLRDYEKYKKKIY